MPWDELIIEADARDGWIALRRTRGESDHARGTIPARRSITREELVAALTATPWAAMHDGRLVVAGDIACRRLAALIDEMLGCFTRSGSPDVRLAQVRSRLAGDFAAELELDRVSWWHCAWLDVAVREDLADAARSADALWTSDNLSIELVSIRRHRVEQLARLIARSQGKSDPAARRVAASARSRQSATKAKRKSG